MAVGFAIRRMTGTMCISISRCSRVVLGLTGACLFGCSCWVIISMFNEKRAVKVMLRPSKIMVQFDQLNREVMIRISAIKFGDGGRAMLAKVIISHQNDIRGNKACRPRFMKIERVWVRS